MRTHLALTLVFCLVLAPYLVHPLIVTALAAGFTSLPDIDSAHSFFGKRWFLRPLQLITKHRGMLHSFTLCILLSFLFAFILPILSLPLFVGYSSHLLADSTTIEGITPFWPSQKKITGALRTGGKREIFLFYGLLGVSLVLFLRYLYLFS